jgi:hypothetical protein
MTTLAKVQMLVLVNTMLTRQQKELSMDEGSACNCYCPMWKLAFHAMATKMS